jgi:predicted RNA-binding Zn ribbon-like protein
MTNPDMAADLSLLLPRPQHVDQNAGALCLAFINSTESHDGSSRDDLQPGYANVLSWARAIDIVGDADTRKLLGAARKNPREASAIRRRILESRGFLLRIVRALMASEQPDASDLARFEHELRETYAHAHLAVEADTGVMAWQWPEDVHLEQLLWPIMRSAEELLFSDRTNRIQECASDDCEKIFLDTSRNRSRRYCSTGGCGNRERVRKHRQVATD